MIYVQTQTKRDWFDASTITSLTIGETKHGPTLTATAHTGHSYDVAYIASESKDPYGALEALRIDLVRAIATATNHTVIGVGRGLRVSTITLRAEPVSHELPASRMG